MFVFKFVLLCSALGVALGGVAQVSNVRLARSNTEEPGCYVAELGRVLPVGSSAPARDSCSQITCRSADSHTYISGKTCGVMGAPPSCRQVVDETKPFPDCCPRFICP